MKQVTIEAVRERIARIEECAIRMPGGLRLSMNTEFELACLRQLLAAMDSEPVAWRWRSGWKSVQVVPDEMTADGIIDMHECGYVEGWNACRAAMLNQAQPAPVVRDEMLLQSLETRIRSLEIGERKGALSTQQETSLKAYRLAVQCLRSSATSDENATDNTAQQFEALATIQPQQSKLSHAMTDVIAERQRQVNVEGWQPGHDDQYVRNDLVKAAVSYCMASFGNHSMLINKLWPWNKEWWKPSTPRRNLVKAGALILAEIERLDRMTTSAGSGKQ